MTQTPETIGFVGAGLMGHGMARNIVKKGYYLTVIAHRNRAPIEDLVERGAIEARSMQELAGASSVIFLCLTGSPEVEAAVAALKREVREGSVINRPAHEPASRPHRNASPRAPRRDRRRISPMRT